MPLPLNTFLSALCPVPDDRLNPDERGRALSWMRRNADSIQWWLLSTAELRRCRFHRYLRRSGRLTEDETEEILDG